MFWLVAAWMYHLAHSAIKGHHVVKSLKIFGLMGLFFISVAAVYMNHYTAEIKTFYLYSMLDAVILFPLVGLANGLLYPRIMTDGEAVETVDSANKHGPSDEF